MNIKQDRQGVRTAAALERKQQVAKNLKKLHYLAGEKILGMKAVVAGVLSGRTVRFSVPLPKPVVDYPTVTVENADGVKVMTSGGFVYGGVSIYATPTYEAVINTAGWVDVTATFTSGSYVPQVCAVELSLDITIT